MPRLKKLAVEISSRRFVEDRNSLRTSSAPVFYSGETQDIELSVLEKTPAGVRDVIASANGAIKVRLGSTTTLAGTSTTFSYDAPAVIQATGTVGTVEPVSIPLNVTWSLAPTAAPTAAVNTRTVAVNNRWFTPGFVPISKKIAYNNATAVTATLVSYLQGPTVYPNTVINVPTDEPNPFTFPGLGFLVEAGTVTFSSQLNSVQAASFSVTTSGASVSSIGIVAGGTGYPDGTYALTFDGGTVTSVAQANALASGGSIVSVTIVTGGSGYVTAPAASLFTPAKSVQRVLPSLTLETVNGRPRFPWHHPLPNLTTVTLNLGPADNTTTPPTVIAPVVVAQYVQKTSDNYAIWEINVTCAGYGYTTAPAVTVPPISVSARRRTTVATVSGTTLAVTTTEDGAVTASAEEGSLFAGGRPFVPVITFFSRQTNRNSPFSTFMCHGNGELSPGNYTVSRDFATVDRTGSTVVIPRASKNGTRDRVPSTQFMPPVLPISGMPLGGLTHIPAGGNQFLTDGQGRVESSISVLGGPTRRDYEALYGKTFLCAVVPVGVSTRIGSASDLADASNFNEGEPNRYALVRVSFPAIRKTTPDYYVQFSNTGAGYSACYQDLQPNGYLVPFQSGVAAPGGGFFEPTIEFLDYGKGYATQWYGDNNVYKLAGYILRPLSRVAPGASILSSPVTRSVAAITASSDNFYNTILSRQASVTSRPTSFAIEYVVDGSNFGYTETAAFSAATASVATGSVSRVALTNAPRGYNDGTYPLTFTGGSPVVTATGQIVVSTVQSVDRRGRPLPSTQIYSVVVCSPGSGYVSAPTVTVQAPQALTASVVTFDPAAGGSVYHVRLDTGNPPALDDLSGYPLYRGETEQENFRVPLYFSPSPVTGGTAEGYALRDRTPAETDSSALRNANPGWNETYLQLVGSGQYLEAAAHLDTYTPSQMRFIITNPGYGYVTAPAVTLAAPSVTGYRITKADFSAGFGEKVQESMAASVLDTWKNVPGSTQVARVVTRHGLPYGTYPVAVSSQPADNGQEASLDIIVTPGDYRAGSSTVAGNDVVILRMNWSGAGYASIPTLTPPSASGLILSTVTLTSGGFYYDSTVSVRVVDPTGTGGIVTVGEIASGKIQNIRLVRSGHGYSSAPQLVFGPPQVDPIDSLTENAVRFTLTVTTSAANSILKTSDEVTAQLEIYEENQTEQAVLAQIPVRLAKRVKES